jgi:PAS domain S-box-containing protein
MVLQGNERGIVLMPMLGAVMLAAYVGGRNAGLVTTLVATATALVIAPPMGVPWVASIHDLERVIGIAVLGTAISFTVEALYSARRRAEAAYELARRGEARFSRLFVVNPVANCLTRLRDGIILDVNDAFCRTFGVRREQIVNRAPSHAGLVFAAHVRDKLLADVRSGNAVPPVEAEVRTPDGAVRHVLVQSEAIDVDGEMLMMSSLLDLTDRKRAELVAEKLQQAQKLESIGLLAGGVAHDFNNILCAITANAELLAESVTRDDPRGEWVSEIQVAAERASALTRQLLSFSRKQLVKPVVLDLNKTVDDARRMLRRMLGEDIALRVALDPDVGRVHVDPAQIVQVMMNLCVNARDAMGARGSIFIETRAEADAAVLMVSDTGPGMRDDVKVRVFEPFFTTKPVGKGTGLGLAVVHGIVEQAGGSIELESELGKGTSFRIRLPIVACGVADAPAVVWSPAAGREQILLVDDDELLRVACARSLERLGYRVIQACDGIDALRVLRRSGREIDLLVTDVVMPNMNGRELAEVAARELPGLPVLYTSGYAADELDQRGIEHGEVALLEKPFRPHALARKIRELIDPPVPARRPRSTSSLHARA